MVVLYLQPCQGRCVSHPRVFYVFEEFAKEEEVCYRNSKFLGDSSPELSPDAADSQVELTITRNISLIRSSTCDTLDCVLKTKVGGSDRMLFVEG
jgi:hypothetical protein